MSQSVHETTDSLPSPQPLGMENIPAHIAIIMDGNGRWAQKRGLPRIEGHARGIDVVRNIVRECSRLGVQQLTLYCLSSENWKRPRQELDFLMELLQTYLIQERPELLQQNIRFSTIGRMGMLPDEVQMQIQETMNICRDNTGMGLSLAINYGSRQEMVDAVKKIANQVTQGSLSPDQIDESVIASSLYTNGMPDPDLLIRTAGEMRISNFLLWQISYAEIWVTSKEWPDFTVPTLHEAIGSYSQRNRKFGGLKG
ncbi:MAG: hypothetical protein RIR17_967 [Planctomycetota bacterium]|jgi:undecaprenyl diphosphate synthase